MLDLITKLPVERLDVGLQRTLTAFGRAREDHPFPGSAPVPAMPLESPLERFCSAFEEIRSSLHNSTIRLGANADLLTATARVLSEGPSNLAEMQLSSAVAELKAAIEELTVAVERVPAVAERTRTEPAMKANPRESQTVPDAALGRELRELLKEFD